MNYLCLRKIKKYTIKIKLNILIKLLSRFNQFYKQIQEALQLFIQIISTSHLLKPRQINDKHKKLKDDKKTI